MLPEHLPFFRHIFWVAGQFHHSVPISWSPKTNQVTTGEIRVQRISSLIKQILHFVSQVVFLAQCLESLWKGKLTFFDKLICGVGAVGLLATFVSLRALNRESTVLCLYVNGLLNVQKRFSVLSRPDKLSLICRLNLLSAYWFYVTIFGFPVMFVYGFHWTEPCKPTLIGYWVLPECNQLFSNCGDFLWKLMVFGFNHWLWSFGMVALFLGISGVQILCTMTLQKSLNM